MISEFLIHLLASSIYKAKACAHCTSIYVFYAMYIVHTPFHNIS